MINNVIHIRITEENKNTCLNYLVLKNRDLESSALEIQTIKPKDRIREVKVHSEKTNGRSKFKLTSNYLNIN